MRSVSSSFFCPSLGSPEPEVKYPRGIINPNYPGFQHLAHTLAEHFVDHHFEQSDSEISEFEVELKTSDSDNGNNNNNNINEDLDKIEQILKGVFNSKDPPAVEAHAKFENKFLCHNVTDINKMKDKCDVLNINNVASMKEDSKVITAETKRIYSTPDILIKSNSSEEHIDFTEINEQPDILKNVFTSDVVSDQVVINEKCENYDVEKCEHSQWSITPIDIVGDFEQEVEREFGLIVSGYKSSSSDDEMCVSVKKQVDDIGGDKISSSMYEKVILNFSVLIYRFVKSFNSYLARKVRTLYIFHSVPNSNYPSSIFKSSMNFVK